MLRQRVQQRGIRGLQRPRRRRRIVGIEPRRVERIRRIHDAASEELRPHVIHGGAGELEIAW